MMTENNNPVVMTWFQQQQTPAGWFDLLIIMIEGMLNNAGELESQPFLRQMGASLARTACACAIRRCRSAATKRGACAGATRSVPYSRGYILAGCRVREAVPT